MNKTDTLTTSMTIFKTNRIKLYVGHTTGNSINAKIQDDYTVALALHIIETHTSPTDNIKSVTTVLINLSHYHHCHFQTQALQFQHHESCVGLMSVLFEHVVSFLYSYENVLFFPCHSSHLFSEVL